MTLDKFANKTILQLCVHRNALKRELHLHITADDTTQLGNWHEIEKIYQDQIDEVQAEIDRREAKRDRFAAGDKAMWLATGDPVVTVVGVFDDSYEIKVPGDKNHLIEHDELVELAS